MANPPEGDSRSAHIDDPLLLGRRLREQRVKLGLTLRQLAFDGCTAPYISAIEHGRRAPSLQIINRLAERLEVSADWLARGVEANAETEIVDAELALRLGERERAEHLFVGLIGEQLPRMIRSRAYAGLGEIDFHRGETAAAIEQFESALELGGHASAELATAVDLLGRCYALRGDHETAIALFERARDAALSRGDRLAALRFTVLLANAYVDLGDLAGSASAIAASLRDADELADPLLRARVAWTQSRLHAVEGRHDLAAEFGRQALTTLRAAEDDHAVARAQQMLAYIEIERGNASEALELLDAAAPTVRRLAGAVEQAGFDLERARALLAVGRTKEAKALALEVMPVLVANAQGNSGRAFIVLGDLLAASGERETALGMFDAAVDALSGNPPYLARAFQRKAEVLEALGRRDEAFEAIKLALSTQQRAGASAKPPAA